MIVKHVAPLRQYHAAYVGGHVYVGKVIFGLAEGGGGRGFGVFRLEHASEKKKKEYKIKFEASAQEAGVLDGHKTWWKRWHESVRLPLVRSQHRSFFMHIWTLQIQSINFF